MNDNFDITLIRLPKLTQKSMLSFSSGIPPIGLAYIAGMLRKNNFNYNVIDALGEAPEQNREIEELNLLYTGLSTEEIIERIPLDTTIIGISVMFTAEWFIHKEIIGKIKLARPNAVIILGGEHASSSWETILSNTSEVNYCVVGEGEESFLELLKRLKDNIIIDDSVSGIALRINGIPTLNPRRKRTKNIDDYETDWDKFPVENFLDIKSGMNTLELRAMPILASRGCPYQCTFCSSPFMWGTNYFTREPQSVVSEMKELIERFNVEHFDFTDLSATINKKWTHELCDLILKEDLNISWQFGPGTRSEILTNDVLEKMKQSNLFKISFAPESGSPVTVKKIKKNINIKKLESSIRHAVKIGLHTKCQFIMGLPGQSIKEMIESALFILKLSIIGVDDISIYVFYPYPGSELSNSQIEQGVHISEKEYAGMVNTRISQGSLPNSQKGNHSKLVIFIFTTCLMFSTLFISYIRRPFKIFQTFHNVLTARPRRSIEMLIYLYFKSFNKRPPKKIKIDSI